MAYFLRIEGVLGESTDARHKDEIDVESFAFAERQGVPKWGSTGGAGGARVDWQEFIIQIRTSKASPMLLLACASGKHFKTAALTASDERGDWLVFKFEEVIVSSFSINGDQSAPLPAETLSLSFGKITMQYTHRSRDGAALG